MSLTILEGHVLDRLRGMEAESVQCSCPHTIQLLATQPKLFALFNILIGKGQVRNGSVCPIFVREIPMSCYFCPVIFTVRLEFSKFKNCLRLVIFNLQEWKKNLKCLMGSQVGYLITKKLATFVGMWLLLPVPTTKTFREKTNGSFINHSDLNNGAVSWRCSALAFICLALFDPYVGFAIHQA